MPIYNEEATIEAVITEWIDELSRLEISFVFLAINDGSKDGTGTVLQNLTKRYPGEIYPVEKTNAGHGQACRTGYLLAVEKGPDWTLQIDSDGQCDPKFFAEFWNNRHEADAVFGIRKTRDDGWARVFISTFCDISTSLICRVNLQDINVPYRLIRTSFLREAFSRIPHDFFMQNAALTVSLKRDRALRWKYIPIHFRDRQGGTNSINLKSIIAMGWELLTNLHKIG